MSHLCVGGLILGTLLDAVCAAIRNVGKVQLSRVPRLADFAKWVTAGESAFGWKPETCLDAYFANQEDSNIVVLEGNPIASMIIELAHDDGGVDGHRDRLVHEAESPC